MIIDPAIKGFRRNLAVLVCAGLLVVFAHIAFDKAARFAETRLGAYLWKEEDSLRLFSPANYEGRGRNRLLILGPSEAREGLLPEVLEARLPGIQPYQNALSVGTLEDSLVVLDYIERVYGRTAVPDMVLVGITTRFISGLRTVEASPLLQGIERFSPAFTLDRRQHPPALVPRSRVDSLRARVALLRMQPERYRLGVFAIGAHLAIAAHPQLEADRRFWEPVRAARYTVGGWSSDRLRAAMVGGFWETKMRAWDPEHDRNRISRELHLLIDFAGRRGIDLFVVNLPENSWNRVAYEPGRYEAYLDVVRSAIGNTPFLNLRSFLSDQEFADAGHPNWKGSIRISQSVATFVAAQRDPRIPHK